MPRDSMTSRRRRFLKATGVVAIGGLAGCTGDDGNGGGNGDGDGGENGDGNGGEETDTADPGDAEYEMVMRTNPEDSSTYAVSQGKAAVVNENSDTVFLDARPSEGTDASVGYIDRGEADIAYIQGWTAGLIQNGEEPFDDLGFTPTQCYQMLNGPWIPMTIHDDWEVISDIEEGSTGFLSPTGGGTFPAIQRTMEHAGFEEGDYEAAAFSWGDQSGAFSEGRLDFAFDPYFNFDIVPAYVQEMTSTNDLKLMDWSDEAVQSMEEDDRLVVQEVDTSELQEHFINDPGSIHAMALGYNFITPRETEYDALYELLTTMYENREELADYHALLEYYLDDEFWLGIPYDMPYHPAAADFLEEIGVWNDDLTRAD